MKCVRALLKAGADVTLVDRVRQNTALAIAEKEGRTELHTLLTKVCEHPSQPLSVHCKLCADSPYSLSSFMYISTYAWLTTFTLIGTYILSLQRSHEGWCHGSTEM